MGWNNRGLFRINAFGVSFSDESDFGGRGINALFEDREGNLWAGGARGLERIRDGIFVTYKLATGSPPSKQDGPIYVDRENRTWFAPAGGGLYVMKDGRAQALKSPLLRKEVIYSITGRKNEIWIGTQHSGLKRFEYRNGVIGGKTYTQANGLAENSVFAVYQSQDAAVWAATLTSGISKFKDGRFVTYTTADGLASNTVSAILETRDGTMWFATPNGLSSLTRGHWTTYAMRDGLPSNSVNCLFEDSSGVLWIGTPRGLAFFKSGRVQVPRDAPDSLREEAFGMSEDKEGWLWIATSGHVLRVSNQKLSSGVLSSAEVCEYGVADGLPNAKGVKRSRSVVADWEGKIWFSLARGLSVVDPSHIRNTSAPALPHVEAIVADNDSITVGDLVRIPSSRKRITFMYSGLSFAVPERIRFRYFLKGFDRGWSEPTASREAVYTNLGPGSYRFRVIASNSYGQWNDSEAAISLEVDPAFWQTWWLRGSCVAAFLALLWAIYQLRLRQVARQFNIRLEERVSERTRMARDLHDTFLQTIQGSKLVADDALEQSADPIRMHRAMQQLSFWLASAMQEGRAALNSLRTATTQTNDLAAALRRVTEDGLIPSSMAVTFSVIGDAREMHPIVRDEIYRIGYEAIRNACMHSGASRLEVELRYARDLTLRVDDNGAGIDPVIADRGKNGHFGLQGMRERAARIGGKLTLRSSSNSGTKITLVVPGGIIFRKTRLTIPGWHFLSVLSFLLALNSAWAVDPTRHISQYAHTAWRVQDGVFSGAPNAITQTADGYLWIGTQAGLLRFDGVRFVPWTPPEGKHLPFSNVTSLLGARDGSLWIGMEGGLSHWDNRELTNYLIEPTRINSIIEDHSGTVWLVRSRGSDSAGGLCQIIGTRLQCYGKEDGLPGSDVTTTVVEDRLGNLWVGSDTAVVRWKPGSSTEYSPRGLKSYQGLDGVQGLVANPDASVWVGIDFSGPGLGLQQLVQDAWKPLVVPGLDGSTLEVQTLFLDRENVLWIGTLRQGIYRIHDRKVDHFKSADGLSSDAVYRFYEDRESILWAATAKGIDCFRDVRVATFSTREGLSVDEVDSVLASEDGTLWSSGPGALDALHQGSVSSIRAGKGLPGNQVTSLLEDHAGRLWVGIDKTMSIYKNGKFRRVGRRDGTAIGAVVGMTEDVDHNIWVETIGPPRTLIRIHDLNGQEEFPVPQMPAARKIAADPQGGIWLGLMNGDLARYRHGKTEVFAFKHSGDSRVNQLIVNSDGSVLGATGLGLVGWKEGKQQTLTVRNGLPCDFVNALIEDSQGALWLYTQCGLVEIAGAEMQRWWQQPDITLQLKTFDAFDGAQPGRAPFAGAAKTPDGRLWFANGVLLQMIDPDHLTGNALPPPVHVEEVIADRKNYSPRKDLHLPALTRDLEIDYTALSFVAPQKVRFRYKLEGRDAAWQEPGARRQAFYSDLRPGRYKFRVIACNNDGVWNNLGATLDFSVAPAWYQTNWFRILCVGSGVLMVWVVYRLRVRQISGAIGVRFDERLAERTRMARDLHDTFLQTIQGSKLVADDALEPSADPMRMRRALEQLSVWLARAMQEGRAALNSLRTATTQANDLAEALRRVTEDGVIPKSMAVIFSAFGDAREMHPIVRDEIYRIGYEAIRNACMHSGASRLEVELIYADDLAMRVSDNGTGIDPAVANRGKDGHFGLQGMRERTSRIGGKLTLGSSSISGTEIKLTVPGRIVFRKTMPARRSLLTRIRTLCR
jgi:signal transduction histidine kinase/ligand-binding sensor domain-containing protein